MTTNKSQLSLIFVFFVLFTSPGWGGLISSNGRVTNNSMTCLLTDEVRNAAPITTLPFLVLAQPQTGSFTLSMMDPAGMTSEPMILLDQLTCAALSSDDESPFQNQCMGTSNPGSLQENSHIITTVNDASNSIDFDIQTPSLDWKFSLPQGHCQINP